MAITLGTFTKLDDGVFTGTLKTLNVAAALTIVPIDKMSENAPDYRVYAGQRYEVGAAWSQVAKSSGETTVAGFTAYGRKGLPAERVAETACQELLSHHRSGAPVDPYLADQLVLPMILADGESRVRASQVSQHLLTNVWVVRQFLAADRADPTEIYVEGEMGSPGTVVVKGQGYD